MDLLTLAALALGGVLLGGLAGAVYAFRKPDPNPNGLLARKQSK